MNRKLSLWEPRICPHTRAVRLDFESTYKKGKFNEIVFLPAIIDLTAHRQNVDSCRLYFSGGRSDMFVDRMPILNRSDEKVDFKTVDRTDRLYDFSLIKSLLLAYCGKGFKYLHVMVKDDIRLNYKAITSLVVWQNQKHIIGSPSLSISLTEEEMTNMERLFGRRKQQSYIKIFEGSTFHQKQIAMTA